MAITEEQRSDRFRTASADKPAGEGRNAFQRDRDRILYANALRRLAGVTQVVSPIEGDIVHNRLTHTLKVAQIARRTAELLKSQTNADDLLAAGGLDPEVCEAAALAHDLGLPPFAHIGEQELSRLVREGDMEGYEGNPQSFRIVNSLAVRATGQKGLNLTRATLNAMLKYPAEQDPNRRLRKWGAYNEESEIFRWARLPELADKRTLEAEIMDLADDITYAVHDVEDFYRAGLIPLNLLVKEERERKWFLDHAKRRWSVVAPERVENWGQYETALETLLGMVPASAPYRGDRLEQAALREMGSSLITGYLAALRVNPSDFPRLIIERDKRIEIDILKELNWTYVIESAALRTLQHGQRKIVDDLFEIYASSRGCDLVPVWLSAELDMDCAKESPARFAADLVSSLSDRQAIQLHQRLTGAAHGSVRDWI